MMKRQSQKLRLILTFLLFSGITNAFAADIFPDSIFAPTPGLPHAVGVSFGQNKLSLDNEITNINNSSIEIELLDDNDIAWKIFYTLPYKKNISFDFSYENLGSFNYTGEIKNSSGTVIGNTRGSIGYKSIQTTLNYHQNINSEFFTDWRIGAKLGPVFLLTETFAEISGTSNPTLIDRSENDLHAITSIYTEAKFLKSWIIGPSINYLAADNSHTEIALNISWTF